MRYTYTFFILIMLTGCETFNRNSEIAWQTMHIIDIAQTVQTAKNPHCRSEGNALTQKIIGKHPSESNVYKWGIGSAIAHYFIFKWIDKKAKKDNLNVGLRVLDNTSKFVTIARNHGNGVRVNGLSTDEQKRCDRELEIQKAANTIDIPLMRF